MCIQDFFLSIKIEILSQLTFTDTLTYKISTIWHFFKSMKRMATKNIYWLNWRTLLIISLLQQNSTWLTERLSTSQVFIIKFREIVSSQSLTRVFLKPVVSLCLKDDGVRWLPWLPFPSTDAFVLLVPVFLLTFDRTVRGVPTAMVHGFFLTVIALKLSWKK